MFVAFFDAGTAPESNTGKNGRNDNIWTRANISQWLVGLISVNENPVVTDVVDKSTWESGDGPGKDDVDFCVVGGCIDYQS